MPPPDHKARFDEALGWLRDHLLNHADIAFGRILREDPANVHAERYRGIALVKLGRGAEGLTLLRHAAEASADPVILHDLAVAERLVGDEAAARAAFQRANPGVEPPTVLTFLSDETEHGFRLIDYPYRSTIRYGAGKPPHPGLHTLIDAGRDRYAALIDRMADIAEDFAKVPLGGTYDLPEPFWLNGWFPPLDGMGLTQFLRDANPARFIEIGSGVSTKFARRAVEMYGLRTHLTSIDPQPRNQIDQLCDRVIRQPLEEADPTIFDALAPGDILFLDSSHRSFQGSDVTVFFLDVLPRVKPGVLIHIHDIYLPDDYISGHVHRLWNEQYLLATTLLFGDRFEVLFPSWFVHTDPDLSARANAALRKGPLASLNLYGASFWMTHKI